MSNWVRLFSNKISSFDDDFIFIAHSFGCLVALKLVEKVDIKISDVVLVACPKNKIEGCNLESLWKKISDRKKDILTKFVEQDFDWDIIKSKIRNLNFFLLDDDFAIPYEETLPYYKSIFPKASFKTFKNYGHFNRRNNICELPEVLEIIEK